MTLTSVIITGISMLRPAHQQTLVLWPHVDLAHAGGRGHAKEALKAFRTFQVFVVGAHVGSKVGTVPYGILTG